jgi:hypothetical protein
MSCGSGLMSGLRADGAISCFCPATPFIPSTTATVSGTFDVQSWPGGQLALGSGSCSMTLNVPSGRIDATGTHSGWSVRDRGPYSSCRVIGRVPDCNTVAGTGRLTDSGLFPACSSALGETPSTAVAVVLCH